MDEQIIYTDWGIANIFKDGTIELHKDLDLPEWKHLKLKILDHERDHNFEKGFFYNMKIDLFYFVSSAGLLRFMFSRPKTWIQMLPIYYSSKKNAIIYDKNLFVFYVIIIFGILAFLKLIQMKGGA